MEYGYVRISTKSQSIERQIRNIKEIYPNAIIVQEAYTGTTMQRPYWNKLVSRLKPNDTLIFDSVSRMARNAEDGYKAYQELYDNDIELVFIKEPHINTKTYKEAVANAIPLTNSSVDFILDGINKYLLELAKQQIKLAFQVSQKEVDDLHQRTIEGLLTAKLNGKILGHKKGTPLIMKSSISDKNTILKYSKDFNGTLSDVECIKLCKCCNKTYYRYKKQLKEALKDE